MCVISTLFLTNVGKRPKNNPTKMFYVLGFEGWEPKSVICPFIMLFIHLLICDHLFFPRLQSKQKQALL